MLLAWCVGIDNGVMSDVAAVEEGTAGEVGTERHESTYLVLEAQSSER